MKSDNLSTSAPEGEALYEVALSLMPNLGPLAFKNLISYTGKASHLFTWPPKQLLRIPRITLKVLEHAKEANRWLEKAHRIQEQATKRGMEVLHFSHPHYPDRLRRIEDSPLVLFVKQESSHNLSPLRTVGIVGTRHASAYGLQITKHIIEELSPYTPTIISGLAYGIDIQAHKHAMRLGLSTWAVLGSPLDQIYPSQHEKEAKALVQTGALISEYRPGEKMLPSNFPQRNRLIAGLSDAIIVVEAAKQGGALITAELAYGYQKEVFAVPGNLTLPYSEGCNALIKTLKSAIYMDARQVAKALHWNEPKEKKRNRPKNLLDKRSLSATELAVVEFLEIHKESHLDALCRALHLNSAVLAPSLLKLEFEGVLCSLPGNKIRWTA
ncbi:DNA protecting protein DprA [Nitritalea halalkaliphila LW7]|uniref:DNA protecting protein DprA n=1 Tax=Nitritalea halalkaliphila LW7 TaxID=1189621 RepID=I5CAL4_9BACT|nr:DNA-processing protein DprA [Nitritalea halalkaliphila]EIM78866.1 DNA protecting protein DprA [Nitritalea halalkaliphila LW7]